jgi:hypothetical protein
MDSCYICIGCIIDPNPRFVNENISDARLEEYFAIVRQNAPESRNFAQAMDCPLASRADLAYMRKCGGFMKH